MKAAIYARYSSDNQREESIDAQIRAIKDFANHNNIQIVKIYTDEARSATTDDRPQFLQMIKDSEFNIFNTVIVHKLDRFSRNRYDSAFYKKKLKDNHVKLISVLEHLDDSPESIILESVLEGMAEYYSINLSREVMKGMKETALQCKHTGGIPPLGYDVNPDKTYCINEKEANAIRLIFQMYASGTGYTPIIDKLNDLGYKSKTGKGFGKNSLYGILTNEKYRGVYIFNKSSKKINGKRNSHKIKSEDEIIKIEGGMPAIISEDLWKRVKIKMDSNKINKGANTAKAIYLLSGLIYCGKCGSAMTGNRRYAGRNKSLYETYECSNRKRTKQCDMKAINKDYVEQVVIDDLYNNIFSDSAIENIVPDIFSFISEQNKIINEDIKIYKKELANIQTKIDNMLDAIANGFYNSSMKEKSDQLETRKTTLLIRINEAEREAKLNSPTEDMIKKYLKKDSDIKEKSLENKKKVIQTHVQKITVYEDRITTDTIVSLIGGGDGCRTRVRK
ncbi:MULTISPECIES: recombinase family protein [Clostridium]|uniref:recombinase family protein n=1 Tax=Clostridium TaxID=1485 RepID=UPI0015E1A2AC|nr:MULTISPECIES: recombinase family protein [Clostridium]MBN7575447.1 recombinase family protein [Clostridium beijerinckii]MBN7580758.1 recombinase family protein [Clostridium beijerinckii]MBN7585211.1 recombinase family protein [Clostridium beijerinckii]MBO0521983.1 recombinase family protein [Clostridium beijerinckii]